MQNLRLTLDDHRDWVTELAYGDNQHLRHRPPFQLRSMVLSELGRASRFGADLECVKCDKGAPRDHSII